MTKTEEEFYKFLIDPNNFDAVCDVVQYFRDVEERLVYDFWVDVKTKCEERLKNRKGWQVYLPDIDDAGQSWQLTIFMKKYERKDAGEFVDFAVCMLELFGAVECGLWVYDEAAMFDKEDIIKIAKENKRKGWKTGTYWAYYRTLPEDFSEISNLKKIRPDSRAFLVNQYVDLMIETMDELEPFINKHILKKK